MAMVASCRSSFTPEHSSLHRDLEYDASFEVSSRTDLVTRIISFLEDELRRGRFLRMRAEVLVKCQKGLLQVYFAREQTRQAGIPFPTSVHPTGTAAALESTVFHLSVEDLFNLKVGYRVPP